MMEKTLQFHGLMNITSKHMIERYNRALKASCGFTTSLTSFHIDCSGYSPEIAEECGDIDYLNTHGANKRFIIISVEQANLPITQAYFSTTVHFVKQFISDNYKQLLSMTALDSVYGEFENNIYKIKNLKDLIYATKVEVKLETSKGLIQAENELNSMIGSIKTGPDENWLVDSELREIINVVERVGDIRKNTLKPQVSNYDKKFYHANHLGGMYVVNKGEEIVILANPIVVDKLVVDSEQSELIKEMNIRFIELTSIESVYDFLESEQMIESLGLVDIINSKEEIEEYIRRIAIESMISKGEYKPSEEEYPSQNKIKNHISKNYDDLGSLFDSFNRLCTQIQRNEEIDVVEDEIVFYFAKVSAQAEETGNKEIVNHLLSNYTSYKYESNFLGNRGLFFDQYNTWPKEKQIFVGKLILNSIS